jgi:eukaryotic-like serine/threonine-protein kinase
MTLTGEPSPLVLAERYRIDERIGAGSMGAVWRATDQLLGRSVAVKQLLLQPGTPGFDIKGYEEAKQRILREGRLAARLQHPHTISVFDVVLHDDAPWLVMEYLPSRTFGALLDAEGPIEPRRAAGIGTQIADGLAAAHAAGIVHRDIKPGNVLIASDGTVKITDFGVSRAADDVQLTRTGMIAGTPAFLAPEIARGRTPTSAADVFALGSTLYAAVEGLPPFGLDDNAYALLYAVGEGKIAPPTKAGPLAEPLMRMLRKEPTERPSAAQVRDELAAVAAGRTATVRSDVPAEALSLVGAVQLEQPEVLKPADKSARLDAPTRIDVMPLPPAPTGVSPRPAAARVPGPAAPRGPVLVGISITVLMVLAVAIIVGMLHSRGAVQQESSGPRSSSAAGPGSPPAPVRISGQPSAAQLADFIVGYYKLLPDNPQAGWKQLGPQARSASDGFAGYLKFYAGLDAVSIVGQPYAAPGSDIVRATLRFNPKDGGETTEHYQFTVVPGPDGSLIMRSFAKD